MDSTDDRIYVDNLFISLIKLKQEFKIVINLFDKELQQTPIVAPYIEKNPPMPRFTPKQHRANLVLFLKETTNMLKVVDEMETRLEALLSRFMYIPPHKQILK